MGTYQKPTGRAASMPAGLLMGSGISMGTTIFLSVLAGKLLEQQILPETAVGYCAMFILLISSIAGAYVAVNKIKRRKMMVSALSGTIYFLMLLSVTALFFGGQYEAVGVTALLIAGGCAIVMLPTTAKGRGGAVRKLTPRRKW